MKKKNKEGEKKIGKIDFHFLINEKETEAISSAW